jgi:TonB family protein
MKQALQLFLAIFPFLGFSQDSYTEYYADRWLSKPVKAKNANFIKTNHQYPGGITCTEIIHTGTQEILSLEMYRGKEPIGKWWVPWGQGHKVFDYDFELVYGKKFECNQASEGADVKQLLGNRDPFRDFDSVAYEAPVPAVLLHQIMRQVVYPAPATEEKVKGKVWIGYRITTEGTLTDIHIVEGLHPAIDKEAMRCIKFMEYNSPAFLKGEPVSVCVTQAMNFKFE